MKKILTKPKDFLTISFRMRFKGEQMIIKTILFFIEQTTVLVV